MNDNIIAHPDKEKILYKSPSFQIIEEIEGGKNKIVSFTTKDGVEMIGALSLIALPEFEELNWKVVIVQPRHEAFAVSQILQRDVIITLIISIIFIGIVIIGLVIWQVLPQKESAPVQPEKISIAILPFEDLTPDKKYEYLCDGIAETLINSLSPIKDLKVPARTSAFSFKGKDVPIKEVGPS